MILPSLCPHSSIPDDWRTFFINANDLTNEGIIHSTKPIFSVQFHPEANGGPLDTAFLFDMFFQAVRLRPPPLPSLCR